MPPLDAHPMSELSDTIPGRQEPLLRTKNSSEWHRSHVPRETSRDLTTPEASTRHRGYLGAESCIDNRSTRAPFKLTEVTYTTTTVPAHLDTSLRRVVAKYRTSPPRVEERSEQQQGAPMRPHRTAAPNLQDRDDFNARDSGKPTILSFSRRQLTQHLNQHRPRRWT